MAASVGDRVTQAVATIGLADVQISRDNLIVAREFFQQARDLSERGGLTLSAIQSLNGLAAIDRMEGHFDAAERRFLRVEGAYQTAGLSTTFVRLNRGLAILECGRYAQASQLLKSVLAEFQESNRKPWAAEALVALAVCGADEGDWNGVQEKLATAKAWLDETGFVDLDLARLAMLLSEKTESDGQPAVTAQALHLAIDQWRELDRDAELAFAQEALDRVETARIED